MTANSVAPYEALLLVSFGGPEGPDDVLPFLQNVTEGRKIPEARLAQVAQHYLNRGGVSPINEECRDLVAALREEFGARGHELPVYWGNRNWTPYLADALEEIAAAGHRRVLMVTTSAYPSYSGCRQYRENVWDALQPLRQKGIELQVDRVRNYAHHPGFVAANVDAIAEAYASLSRPGTADNASRTAPRLVFVTHSLPVEMAASSGPEPRSEAGSYVDWHREVAESIAGAVAERRDINVEWDLAYCSRSGRPSDPWLEPDISDHLRTLAAEGVTQVVVAPIGFTADHMEVVQDLDTVALKTADELGIGFVRAATAQAQPDFVAGLVDLVEERAAAARGEARPPRVIDRTSPGLNECPGNCCPNPRHPGRPAVAGLDDSEPSGFATTRQSGDVWRAPRP